MRRLTVRQTHSTLNLTYKNYRMWELLYTITETISTLFPVVHFLKCVVTEVMFSIVALRHWHFTRYSVATCLRCDGIFSDYYIFSLDSNSEKVWKLVNIWRSYKAYKKVCHSVFDATGNSINGLLFLQTDSKCVT